MSTCSSIMSVDNPAQALRHGNPERSYGAHIIMFQVEHCLPVNPGKLIQYSFEVQFPIRSALMNFRRIFTISMYCNHSFAVRSLVNDSVSVWRTLLILSRIGSLATSSADRVHSTTHCKGSGHLDELHYLRPSHALARHPELVSLCSSRTPKQTPTLTPGPR